MSALRRLRPESFFTVTVALIMGFFTVLLPSGALGALATEVLLLFAVIGGVALTSDKPRHLRVSATMGLLLVTLRWWAAAVTAVEPNLIAGFLGCLFFGYTAVLISIQLFQTSKVDADTIFGCAAAYLLIIYAFATLYGGLLAYDSGLFTVLGEPIDDNHAHTGLMLYYSTITLTSVGYGDVLPIGPNVRLLAALEGTIGQIYIAVLVARLVGVQIETIRTEDSLRPD